MSATRDLTEPAGARSNPRNQRSYRSDKVLTGQRLDISVPDRHLNPVNATLIRRTAICSVPPACTTPVTEPGEGEYIVEIGTVKIPFSMDELRNGINLSLS
jgi:hypothetical protein